VVKARKKRKKARSAKQKAATRKLVARNKRMAKPRRRRASKPKSRPKTRRKNKSTKKPRKKVVSRKGLSKLTSNPILRKVLLAAGAVSVATSVAAIISPGLVPTLQRPIVRAGLGFVTGDFVGAISNFVIGGGGLGSITGGSNGNGNTGGFA